MLASGNGTGMKDKFIDWLDKGPKLSHILFIVVGGYLFYAIYQMISRLDEMSGSKVPVYIAVPAFAFIGLVMIITGGFALATGHYRENQPFTGNTEQDPETADGIEQDPEAADGIEQDRGPAEDSEHEDFDESEEADVQEDFDEGE